MNLFTHLRPEWRETLPERLLDAPVGVLKTVDEQRGAALAEVLGVGTLRQMAMHPVADWVWRTYRLFRAGVQRDLPPDAAQYIRESWRERSCGDWLASSPASLAALNDEQAQRLTQTMGWATVRDMASDDAFEVAREVSRIVTGEPQAPEDAITKPLPSYFGEGTRRFLDRAREKAGRPGREPAEAGTRPAPPPPPPPPPAAPPGSGEGVAAPSWIESGVAPAVAATLRPGVQVYPGTPHTPQHKEYTASGAYIPKGGGSRGWLENQGVAKTERGNRYRYQEVVDWEGFTRAALVNQVQVNNRGAERKELRMQVRWAFDAEALPVPGLCLNVSLTGAKLRLGQLLKEGTALHVSWVHRDELLGHEQALLALTAQVVWCQTVNAAYRRPRFDCGIHFEPLELSAQGRLTLLLTDRVQELIADPLPPPAEAPV